MNETPLKPWLIVDMSGAIDAAHCNCMAGLGESCSHVGALLFYVEAASRLESSKTVTQEKAYWMLPNGVDKVSYLEVKDINFTSAETKKRQLDAIIDGEADIRRSIKKLPKVSETTLEENNELLLKLSTSGSKASILAVKEHHQQRFLPLILQDNNLPDPLMNLKSEKYLTMEPNELRELCRKDLFNQSCVNAQQAENVEKITRSQSKCKLWHRLRVGRITASNMKAVCTSSIDKPAMSTVRSVCGTTSFKNKATAYGCKHEEDALHAYIKRRKNEHRNFSVDRCGFFINPEFSYIGATPDALVSCDCCGVGVVEIKCPFCAKESRIADTALDYLEDGKLKVTHKYFYQVQTQLMVTSHSYCDFVIWSSKDLMIQRILPNMKTQEEIKSKSKVYFTEIVLPELAGSLITRENTMVEQADTLAQNQSNKTEQLNILVPKQINNQKKEVSHAPLNVGPVCLCGNECKRETSDVIKCDSENCQYGFLHYKCVSLKRKPKKPYYCPACRVGHWK